MTDVEVSAVRPLIHLGMVMLAGLSVIGDFILLLSIPTMPFLRCFIYLSIPLVILAVAIYRYAKHQNALFLTYAASFAFLGCLSGMVLTFILGFADSLISGT